MIPRDQYNIIVQPPEMDGGDSAFSTGIMAGCGSIEDLHLMPLFIIEGQLVRHPYQSTNTGTAPHNDPKSVSRDQLLCFFFGASPHIQVKQAALQYAKGWRVNSDVLEPRHKLYLYKRYNETPPLWLLIVGHFNQFLALLWDCYVKPEHEMNQSVCVSITLGSFWIKALYKLHPDLLGNITEYFSGWRAKPEIAVSFNKTIISAVNK